ncbi:hypothetical protein [Streptomyces anulatus]|uniref:hypothetical protein n=1 Tax=Streptomyces anulatus TaxID=1892 RepID=UPI003F49D7B8
MLVDLARTLVNERQRSMRREQRERIGDALSLPEGWAELEYLENERVFVTSSQGMLHCERSSASPTPDRFCLLSAAYAAVETSAQTESWSSAERW